MKQFIKDSSSSINPLSVNWPLNKTGFAAAFHGSVTRSRYRCS